MTEHKAYDRLVSELESLHARTLDQGEPRLQDLRLDFEQRLKEMGNLQRRIVVLQGLGDKLKAAFARPFTWTATGVAALALIGFWGWMRRPVLKVEVSPEPLRTAVQVLPAPAAVSSVSRVAADPCVAHIRAAGNQPSIDDFEDGNPLVGSFESRVGLWGLYRDTDTPGASMPLTPTIRPQPTRGNRFALHAVGGELRDWGATVQLSFQPSCYDASVYGGISFSAKGPGRVYAGVHEVRVVQVEWGGTCTHDCYNTHQKKVDLSARWQNYSLKWSELRQRGYDTPPLDATRVHSIAFLIQPGDTPFDIWIDDLKFIPR